MEYMKAWVLNVLIPSILTIALAGWLADKAREGREEVAKRSVASPNQ